MTDPRGWLAHHQACGTTTESALAFFDDLPTVAVPELFGRWRGSGLPTGHPWDGLLEAFRWWGKEFVDAERVHPLLFEARGGRVVALTQRVFPVRALARLRRRPPVPPGFGLIRPFLTTRRPGARLRMMEHRGRVTATMIYDHLPILDVFRRVDDDTVLGVMDLRDLVQPLLFVLRRQS